MTRRQALAMSGLAVAGALTGNGAATAAEARPPGAVAAGKADKAGKDGINVAILLGQHNTLIDVAGPWEVLSSSGYAGGAFNVYAVAGSRAPVICDDGRGVAGSPMGSLPVSGLTVIPDYGFDDAPQPRVIIIGAQVNDDDQERQALAWIRRRAPQAVLTASVCTGAYLLAKTGLLDGRPATTNRNAYDNFEKTFPKVRLVRGVRFVESGPFATATGLTAGIDLALHIVERFFGRKTAQDLADYEEWQSRAWLGS
jgi:transcriptional regulator GlxA family with amidase domain